MRFFGGGIGHKSTWKATDHFLMDRDCLDINPGQMHNNDDDNANIEDHTEDTTMTDKSHEIVLDGDNDYGYGDPLEEGVDDDEDSEAGSEEDLTLNALNTEEDLEVADLIENFGFGDL